MKKLSEFVNEKLSDIEGKWDPPEGLFAKNNHREIDKIMLNA